MTPIDITESLVRLYVFLGQTLDRCLDPTQQESFPEQEHMTLLEETRTKLKAALSVNPVVKRKIDEECELVLGLADSYAKAPNSQTVLMEQLKAERAILQTKILALSDLLGVLRAQ